MHPAIRAIRNDARRALLWRRWLAVGVLVVALGMGIIR